MAGTNNVMPTELRQVVIRDTMSVVYQGGQTAITVEGNFIHMFTAIGTEVLTIEPGMITVSGGVSFPGTVFLTGDVSLPLIKSNLQINGALSCADEDGNDTQPIASHQGIGNGQIPVTASDYRDANGITILIQQQPAIPNATGAGDVVATVNAVLDMLRTHGLIEAL